MFPDNWQINIMMPKRSEIDHRLYVGREYAELK